MPHTLVAGARAIVCASDTAEKVRLAYAVSRAWFQRELALGSPSRDGAMPDRPGRPEKPVLLAPRDMPKRSLKGKAGRLALIHSLAHIELNAVDLTWDLIGRFAHVRLPRSYYDDWVRVGLEEAKHFAMLQERLAKLDATYGDLPAHDGLWQAAQDTGHDLAARLAIIPLVLEARGLDITPPMIEKAREIDDEDTAKCLDIIYRDEKNHVAFGAKWFRFLCDRQGIRPESAFHTYVRRHFRGPLKPPFNDRARSEAGLTPGFYKPLAPLIG
ncbi:MULTISPECIES: ferritin-like domain-containing protein [unclassified Labrenzia]|uniref:ferritin-like domain-containing protein n=1 Tax=unclassified Labrenzia TaxID=2648686 RepID=UPI001AD94134|nr:MULTISPECIES: ferritin-like domain-containing protein [unclassified Labrenzia]MBO9462743.1 ferritin-like domain-containing protein [Labrenzia sp. R5_0]MCR9282863.1 ferritin-like domain-containing protein [Paracoccaceae bacterium]